MIRRALWLLVGFLFAAVPLLSMAEGTIPAPSAGQVTAATYGPVLYPFQAHWYFQGFGGYNPPNRDGWSAQWACEANGFTLGAAVGPGAYDCNYNNQVSGTHAYVWCEAGIQDGQCKSSTQAYSCPSGSTLINGNQCQSAAACPPNSTGPSGGLCTCSANYSPLNGACVASCPASGTTFSTGYFLGQPSSTSCAPNGCLAVFGGEYPAGRDDAGNLYAKGSWSYFGGGPVGQCTPSAATAPVTSTPKTTAAPCGPDDGVVKNSAGKVTCVPRQTPGAQTPIVAQKTTTTENADGSKTDITTKTTCLSDGTCNSTTTTINTGAGGGSTPGTAGPVGVSSSSEDKTKACDPQAEMCESPSTAGLYEKKAETFNGPLSRFSNGLRNSVLSTNATGFFSVTVPAGACPSWQISQDVMGTVFAVDLRPYFCSSAALANMDIIGTVLMVVAAFAAFRWAIL